MSYISRSERPSIVVSNTSETLGPGTYDYRLPTDTKKFNRRT